MEQQEIEIRAPLASVMDAYRKVDSWSVWDSEVKEVRLSRGLTPGSRGWLVPREGPKAKIEVSEVRPNGFVVTGELPLCQMIFDHVVEDAGDHMLVRHSVRLKGLLSFVFRKPIEAAFRQSLPTTLKGLKDFVERNNEA
jgi:hypothetical protein